MGLFFGVGVANFFIGLHSAINYKKRVRKLIDKVNPDTAYEIGNNPEDITDELTEQILTEAVKREQNSNIVSPKHRKSNGILVIFLGLIILFFLTISIFHEGGVDKNALMFIGVMNFLFTYGIYILVTLRKHNIEYFKHHKFAEPSSSESKIIEDNIEEYVDDLANQEEVNFRHYSIGYIVLILLIVLISFWLKSLLFGLITPVILFFSTYYVIRNKDSLKNRFQDYSIWIILIIL